MPAAGALLRRRAESGQASRETRRRDFRENTEDIYAGIEWPAESPEAKKLIKFLQDEMGVKKIRFPNTSGIGIKPVSREGSERLIRAALDTRSSKAQERDVRA